MMSFLRWLMIAVVWLLALQGCASSPPVQFYTLRAIDADRQTDRSASTIVGIGPLRLAGYLKRPQIVTRGAGTELQIDEFSRWAEPLESSIQRIVASNVGVLLPDVVVVTFPYSSMLGVDYRLVGQIDRFDADQNGLAVLQVDWGVGSVDGQQILVPATRSRFVAQAGRADDPGAVTLALNDTVEQFSREIAEKISAGLAQAVPGPQAD